MFLFIISFFLLKDWIYQNGVIIPSATNLKVVLIKILKNIVLNCEPCCTIVTFQYLNTFKISSQKHPVKTELAELSPGNSFILSLNCVKYYVGAANDLTVIVTL